jgi:hypothetical protein
MKTYHSQSIAHTVAALALVLLSVALLSACAPFPASLATPQSEAGLMIEPAKPGSPAVKGTPVMEPTVAESPQPAQTQTVETAAPSSSSIVMMAAPDHCPSNNPGDYSSLSSDDFWDQKIHPTTEESDGNNKVVYALIKYRNPEGQRFDVYIMSGNNDEGKKAILDYVAEGRVCLQAITHGKTNMEEFEVEPLDESQVTIAPEHQDLLKAVVDDTNILPPDALLTKYPSALIIQFGVAPPESGAPQDVKLMGVDEWDWFDSTLARGNFDLLLGELGKEGIARNREYVTTLSPQDAAEISTMTDEDFLMWFADWRSRNEDVTVYFSMDPTVQAIGANQPHEYKAWCKKKSATATLDGKGNYVYFRFWEDGGTGIEPMRIGTNESSGMITLTTTNKNANFDASVTGGSQPAKYMISEGWVQGKGCRGW